MKAKNKKPKRNFEFHEWHHPEMLLVHPDGSMSCKDGGSVQEYLAAWFKASKREQPFFVTLLEKKYADLTHYPHYA